MSRAFNDLGASMSNSRICFLVKLLHYFLVLIEKEHRGNVPGNVLRESALRLSAVGKYPSKLPTISFAVTEGTETSVKPNERPAFLAPLAMQKMKSRDKFPWNSARTWRCLFISLSYQFHLCYAIKPHPCSFFLPFRMPPQTLALRAVLASPNLCKLIKLKC